MTDIEQLKKRMANGYNPQSVVSMDDMEVREFAGRQARRAAETLSLSRREEQRYARAVFESICYFNGRDERHHAIMRYRAECREAEEQASA